MGAVGRTWLAFAAVGAGLIHLALVIGSPAASAAIFAIVGIVEFAWGLVSIATSRLLAPRVALIGALVPALFWVLAIFVASGAHLPQLATSLRVFPLLVATLLEFFLAATIAISQRRASEASEAAVPSSTARQLLGIAAGVIVIAALTAPALAATQVGELAVPPGTFDDHSGH